MHETIRVLVADDHLIIRQGLRLILETNADFEMVGEAADGAEAVKLSLDLQPDVVLMDLRMPGMDGFETASLIRQRKSTAHIPIIFVTALGDDNHVARGYSLGAVDYIRTPIDSRMLAYRCRSAV